MLERIKGIVPLGKKMLGGKNLSEDREPNVKVKNPVLAAAVLIAVGVFVTSCYYSVGPQAGEENLDGGTEQVDDGSGSDPDLGHLMGVDTDTETNSETDDTDTETDECSTEDEEPYEPEGEGIEKTITFETGPGEECDLDVRVYENGYVETAVFDHRIFYEEAMCPGSFPMEIGDIVIVQAEDSQYINAWGLV